MPPASKSRGASTKVRHLGSANIVELKQLVERRAELAAEISEAKAATALIDERIAAITISTGAEIWSLDPENAKAGEETITFKSHDADGAEIKLRAEVKKTVKWDSEALLKVAAGMTWGTVKEIFKIDFSVPERTWDAMREGAYVPGETRRDIAAARTVKYAPLVVRPA